MLGPLEQIFAALLCLLSELGNIILGCLVAFLNLIIVSAAGWLSVLAALLPNMPNAPTGQTPQALAWANWFYPIGDALQCFAVALALWLGVMGVRAALKMLRAL
jgi:uncharacterized membrane protein